MYIHMCIDIAYYRKLWPALSYSLNSIKMIFSKKKKKKESNLMIFAFLLYGVNSLIFLIYVCMYNVHSIWPLQNRKIL